ncbi:hypothetical protein DPMN_055439 [Dreissena polymorpha]|uniref:Aminotransferase class V domain-containing protein n=1 Tax=Dreissena polymorpha TaxID=45954 RepID=A0A9D4CQ00_DREPO|nr:hypothetical protein DPMN_055439 [Dreissena polymorpha]
MSAAKRDFGSFHSSNVQELLNLSEEEYTPPELPFRCESIDVYKTQPLTFGKNVRKKHFLLEDDCVFLNHGAFGGVLKEALQTAQKYQEWTEKQPLRFYDRELLPRLVHVTRRLAKFVGCDARDIVLIENATTALNTVLQNVPLTKGDKIFCLSVTYGAVKKMLSWRCEQTGAELCQAVIEFPLQDDQQIIDLVSSSLSEGTRLAVFDHIPSNTPFILPLKQIIDICHARNIPVLVDGAHALGSLPLDITSLGADYYVTNAHKWLCAPKGAALLYVKRELQSRTRPLIISHGFGSGFNSEFIWAGLHDYSPFLALHTVLDFWESIGPGTIQQYMHGRCRQAGQMLKNSWKTYLAAPEHMFGSMSLVALPEDLYSHCDTVDYLAAEAVQNQLYHQYNIEVPIKCVQGKLYARISAHIYNEMAEYEILRDAILEMTGSRG